MNAADLDLDIQVLVGEMPEIPCEEPNHGHARNHGGPATHYWRWLHGCSMPAGTVVALCEPKTAAVLKQIAEGTPGICRICKHVGPFSDYTQVVGPIGGKP